MPLPHNFRCLTCKYKEPFCCWYICNKNEDEQDIITEFDRCEDYKEKE